MHARGSGAHGFFECYKPLSKYTKAAPFAAKEKITPVFVRFSTVAGECGSADTARGILQAATAHDTFWDFASLMPESTHVLMWVMSDRGIPRSLRMMGGFSVHTFRLVNAKGVSAFCKFHGKPLLGTHSLVWDEAVKIAGADPDFHQRNLWEAIEARHCPEWEMGLQIFTEEQAAKFSFDVLNATKLIPEELIPVTPVEKAYIAVAFRFQLSKVNVPAIRQRMVSSLRNAFEELAVAVAARLGLALPDAMPRAITKVTTPEMNRSPALSLMAQPGEGDIATRKVAILVAEGMDGKRISNLQAKLMAAGAVSRFVAVRLGTAKSADGSVIEVGATFENTPAVLFDGMVLPESAG